MSLGGWDWVGAGLQRWLDDGGELQEGRELRTLQDPCSLLLLLHALPSLHLL